MWVTRIDAAEVWVRGDPSPGHEVVLPEHGVIQSALRIPVERGIQLLGGRGRAGFPVAVGQAKAGGLDDAVRIGHHAAGAQPVREVEVKLVERDIVGTGIRIRIGAVSADHSPACEHISVCPLRRAATPAQFRQLLIAGAEDAGRGHGEAVGRRIAAPRSNGPLGDAIAFGIVEVPGHGAAIQEILDRALAALGVVKILVGAKALGRSRGGIVAVAGHVARGVIARRRPSGNRIYLIASAVAERRVARNGRGHSAGVSAEALGGPIAETVVAPCRLQALIRT